MKILGPNSKLMLITGY